MKVRGSKHDTGEVLMMAIDLGAKAAGHWQGAHATPIDATFPDVEISNKANRYGYTLRHHRKFPGAALFRRRRSASFLHLRQDRLGGVGTARCSRLSNLTIERRWRF